MPRTGRPRKGETPAKRSIVHEFDPFRPWEQQPSERPDSYEKFLAFRNFGPGRTLAAVSRLLKQSPATIGVLAHRHNWQGRARAWDNHLQAIQDVAAQESREAMVRDHAAAALELLKAARQAISRPKHRPSGWSDDQWENWRPAPSVLQSSTQALDKAIHHQRLAAGMPTDITRQDIVIRERLAEATEVNKALIMMLQEHLCDECRARIIPELERLSRRNELAEGAAVASATP